MTLVEFLSKLRLPPDYFPDHYDLGRANFDLGVTVGDLRAVKDHLFLSAAASEDLEAMCHLARERTTTVTSVLPLTKDGIEGFTAGIELATKALDEAFPLSE